MIGIKELIIGIVKEYLYKDLNKIYNRLTNIEVALKKLTPEEIDINNPMPVIDFVAINSFSIERNIEKGTSVIGYITDGNNTSEWWFKTTIEQHNRLVEQFQEYLNTKHNKPD